MAAKRREGAHGFEVACGQWFVDSPATPEKDVLKQDEQDLQDFEAVFARASAFVKKNCSQITCQLRLSGYGEVERRIAPLGRNG